MKVLKYLSYICLVITISVSGQTTSETIQSVIDEMSLDSLTKYVSELSGDTTVIIDGEERLLESRAVVNVDNDTARQYLEQRLIMYGYSPEIHAYSSSGRNVIAELTGSTYPDKKYIICAHYDNTSQNEFLAPGADDNASGTAAVLESARIMKHYTFPYTILFILFDEEEAGLIGSHHYAQREYNAGTDILGVFNFDMIGYDGNNDNIAEIHLRDVASSFQQGEKMASLNSEFSIGINPVLVYGGTGASDHSSFWSQGYSALLLIEDFYSSNGSSDFNPNYHSTGDTLGLFDLDYFHNNSRLAAATLTYFALEGPLTSSVDDVSPDTPDEYILSQNYPNPFNPVTTINYRIPESSYINLSVFSPQGKETIVLDKGYKPAGKYRVDFNAENLSSGVYIYRLTAGNVVLSRKMILLK